MLTPDRWRQIEELYQAAQRCAPDQRARLLEGADPEIRSRVESMLQVQSGGGILDQSLASFLDDPDKTAVAPGVHLGPYKIEAQIGAGGMGEVWRARDTRLNRFVAIKTSRERFSERFEREAQAIAALNHSHICSLYDVGPDYLVMEYVEGKALEGPAPLDEALVLAGQILEALDAAHRKGIIHRDLKPANILLSRNGVKVLDFGLAKIEQTPTSASGSQAATGALSLTAEGSILGTLPYMSPEQIEGHEADARSDIFSFGVVLYELITGRRPFTSPNQASLIASILKEKPQPLEEVQPRIPAGLARVVGTCLEKDPEKRWQSARELKHALAWISAEAPLAPPPAKPVRLWQGLTGLATLIALGALGWVFWPRPQGAVSRLEALLPQDVTPNFEYVSVSPDGRKIVLSDSVLWIRDFNGSEWRGLPGTEGAASPFWSPDSRYLAFAVRNQIKKVDTTGGPPETLCAVSGYWAGTGAWNRNDTIIFGSFEGGSGGPLWKVSAAGGAVTTLTQVDASKGELYHTWPAFLPDGKHFLYFRSGTADTAGMYAGSLDAAPGDQSRKRILASSLPAQYANGHLFFLRANTLMAQPLDSGQLQLKGAPVPMADAVQTTWYTTGVFSVSPGGVLAYRAASVSGKFQLSWTDRKGKILSTFGPPGADWGITLSPDGKRAVVKDSPYDVPGDLWMIDFSSARRTRLTFRGDVYCPGVWSPDGARIAYAAGDLGDSLYAKASSGAGDERELLKEPGLRHYATSWSKDGRFLLYHTENAPRTGYDLWVLPLQGDRKPVQLLGEIFNEWAGVFSPDMRWIAYSSTEDGLGIYVRPFRTSESGAPSLGEGKWQVSRSSGNWARWRSNKEIIFDNTPVGTSIFAAPVKASGAVFESGVPERLFLAPIPGGSVLGGDVAPDGQRFLIAAPQVQRTAPASISIVLNWPALLKK